MTRRSWSTALLVALAAGGGGWWTARRHTAMEREASDRAAAAAALEERAVRSRDITLHERRAAEDPESAADRTQLAALLLQRSRETADFHDVVRAEETARASLALRTAHNGAASAVLASSLMAQHRFAEARDVARQLVADAPEVGAHRALVGEACLELGDYACAREAFDSLRGAARAARSVAPSLVRWAEIRGDTAAARVLVHHARALALAEGDLPREQLAWYHLRVAEVELRQGRARGAERALDAGLAVSPEDHRLLAARARLAAVRHEWGDAIRWGDRAIAAALDPVTLGVVSDAYAALGDTARAAEYARAMEVAAGAQPGARHRAWELYLLDHDRQVPQVLAAAEAGLAERRDVYGYDVVAWALFRAGRTEDARRAMAEALSQGTQDALLFYHAGMIERAANRPSTARAYLQRALAVSPWFDPVAPRVARAVLDTLARTAPVAQ